MGRGHDGLPQFAGSGVLCASVFQGFHRTCPEIKADFAFSPVLTRREYWNTGTLIQSKRLKLEHLLENTLEHGLMTGTPLCDSAIPVPRVARRRRDRKVVFQS